MSRLRYILLLGVSLLLVPLAVPAYGQFEGEFGDVLGGSSDSAKPLDIESFIVPATGSQPAKLVIRAHIAPGWHIYSLTQQEGGPPKTEITLDRSDQFKLLDGFRPLEPAKVGVKPEAWPDLPIEEHFGQVTWVAPIQFSDGVDPATVTIKGELTEGQVCHDIHGCRQFGLALEPKFSAQLGESDQIASLQGPPPVAVAESEYPDPKNNLVIRGYIEPQVVAPGETAKLHLTIEPDPGWHVYERADKVDGGRPTLLPLITTSGLSPKAPTASGEVIEKDGLRYHEGATTWTIEFQIDNETEAGKYEVEGYLAYLSCTETNCLSPSAVKFATTIQVGEKPSAGVGPVEFTKSSYGLAKQALATQVAWAAPLQDPEPAAGVGNTKPVDFWAYVFSRFAFHQLEDGSWAYFPGGISESSDPLWGMTFSRGQLISLSIALCFFVSFAAGMVLNVMPCVLPVIGLKVMSFAQQGGESRARVFALNVWYSLGLLAVFLAIATFAAALHMLGQTLAWGDHLGDPRFAVPLLALVFILGLSMFGVWEIPIPGFAGSGKTGELANKEGPAGAFFKGVLTTILATPCGGPFIGLAVGIAVIAPIWLNYSIFICMAIGMAAPYLVIGAFPKLVGFIPKPGPWMEGFKQFMGFLLMGTAVWILSFLNESYVVAALAMLVGFGVVCWIVGRTLATATTSTKFKRRGTALAVTVLSLLSFFWLLPRETTTELAWVDFSRATLDEKIDKGHAILVDFTADW